MYKFLTWEDRRIQIFSCFVRKCELGVSSNLRISVVCPDSSLLSANVIEWKQLAISSLLIFALSSWQRTFAFSREQINRSGEANNYDIPCYLIQLSLEYEPSWFLLHSECSLRYSCRYSLPFRHAYHVWFIIISFCGKITKRFHIYIYCFALIYWQREISTHLRLERFIEKIYQKRRIWQQLVNITIVLSRNMTNFHMETK